MKTTVGRLREMMRDLPDNSPVSIHVQIGGILEGSSYSSQITGYGSQQNLKTKKGSFSIGIDNLRRKKNRKK